MELHLQPPDRAISKASARLTDPVCGMTVTAKSFHFSEHAGRPVYFCGARCKARFAAKPAKYLAWAPAAGEPAAGAPAAPARSGRSGSTEPADFARHFIWALPVTLGLALLALVVGRSLKWF